MLRSFFIAFGLFFIQPTFLVGLLAAWRSGNQRIQSERNKLRVAVYKTLVELKEYFTSGLLIGLLLSVVTVAAGMPVTIEWVLLYQVVTLLMFVFGYRFIHPMFTFSMSGLLLAGYYYFIPGSIPQVTYFGQTFLSENWEVQIELSRSLVVISVLLLVGTVLLLSKKHDTLLSPLFSQTRRGKTIASYQIQPLWLVPLLLIIPGEAFTAFFPWWPVFSIGADSYAFFFLPVLVGLRYTLKTQLPEEAAAKLGREFLLVSAVGALAVVASFWYPLAGLVGLVLLLVTGFLALYRHRLREREWQFLYAPEEEGWKVVGIRPDTPAEKLELQVGDTILECNQLSKDMVDDFYQAIEANRVYCKIRVKRADGQIRLAETAIYDDAPHDLGIVTIEDGEN